jgi:hypothetical protein
MKTRLATALLAGAASVVLLSACSTPADTADRPPRKQRPLRQCRPRCSRLKRRPASCLTGVRPTAYRLDLVTDPNAATFTGHEEIDLAIWTKPHARIWLHALGPVVSSDQGRPAGRDGDRRHIHRG